jgi:arylsulfatase
MNDDHKGPDGQTLPGYSGRLNDRCVTIAEALKPAGYFTAISGKWHLGQQFGATPWGRGFDRSLSAAAGGFYYPDSPRTSIHLNGVAVHRNDDPLPKQWYSTDLWTDYALKFVDEARDAKKPFFLYLAHNAPHFPLQAEEADIARWRRKYKAGWDKLRDARHARQVESGVVDKSWPMSPRPESIPAWDSLTPEQQDRYDHIMAIYAAVVERMDKAIGTLVEGLKQRGELDNTLILFMSDNGGNAESGPRGRLDGDKPGDPQSNVFVGECWAWLNNTPFVRYKHYVDEGGISAPLIAHWPKGIPQSRNGQLEKQPGHLVDVMATCLDVAGAQYPKEFNGKEITPLQGTSLRPAFDGKPINRQQPIFWEHESNRAVREGDWKLVALADKPWRLYNLAADRTEQNDLASSQPERVKDLAAKWDAWAARSNVLPLGGWKDTAAEKKAATFSKKKRFTLKAGDTLDRPEAPAIANRGFTITAKFDAKAPDGVIVAQGGVAQGYALFLKDNILTFVVRPRNKALTTVAAPQALPAGPHTAVAHHDANGAITHTVDGRPAATGKAVGPVNGMPVDGLDVGADHNGLVGPYGEKNTFTGTLDSLTIELDPAAPAK